MVSVPARPKFKHRARAYLRQLRHRQYKDRHNTGTNVKRDECPPRLSDSIDSLRTVHSRSRLKRHGDQLIASVRNYKLNFCRSDEQNVVDPAETTIQSRYRKASYQDPSSSMQLRLELGGLNAKLLRLSSLGARPSSLDSGFSFTCASPVPCPPPLGLEPVQRLSEDEHLARKRSNSLALIGATQLVQSNVIASTTRARSRVSVGCNGWFTNEMIRRLLDGTDITAVVA